jgi:hypothetical protein
VTATASRLLTAEARCLAALRQVVALHAGKPRAAAPMLVAAVAQSRSMARREGAAAMAIEVRRALPSLPDVRDLDDAYARRAVTGYLKALDVADAKREQGESVHVPGIVAGKLDLIAATEVPSAFSEERERIEVRFVRDEPSLIPILLKTWNAHLDRACPVCRGLNGQARPWGIDFEGGAKPGRIHIRCRCFTGYMPIPIVTVGALRKQQRRESGVWEWAD